MLFNKRRQYSVHILNKVIFFKYRPVFYMLLQVDLSVFMLSHSTHCSTNGLRKTMVCYILFL